MCAGTLVQFGIPRVVIGDVVHASSDDTIQFMRDKGIEVVVMDPQTSKAAHDCVELVRRFRNEKPEAMVGRLGRWSESGIGHPIT